MTGLMAAIVIGGALWIGFLVFVAPVLAFMAGVKKSKDEHG